MTAEKIDRSTPLQVFVRVSNGNVEEVIASRADIEVVVVSGDEDTQHSEPGVIPFKGDPVHVHTVQRVDPVITQDGLDAVKQAQAEHPGAKPSTQGPGF